MFILDRLRTSAVRESNHFSFQRLKDVKILCLIILSFSDINLIESYHKKQRYLKTTSM